jgi:hypothetical protein
LSPFLWEAQEVEMKDFSRWLWLVSGLVLGAIVTVLCLGQSRPAEANNDRFEDFILCTGAVSIMPGALTDGVWLLDYRGGKLLGTVIDRLQGKIIGWAEVDLVKEFGIQPKQNVHFMMTTGNIALGQAALYVAETSTGKFGVYTMGPRPDGRQGIAIRRHDMVLFRQARG